MNKDIHPVIKQGKDDYWSNTAQDHLYYVQNVQDHLYFFGNTTKYLSVDFKNHIIS